MAVSHAARPLTRTSVADQAMNCWNSPRGRQVAPDLPRANCAAVVYPIPTARGSTSALPKPLDHIIHRIHKLTELFLVLELLYRNPNIARERR